MKTGIIYLKEKNDYLTTGRDYFVARPKLDFTDFSLGGFFLSSNDNKNNIQERILSIDGRYRFPKNRIRLMGQYASNFEGNAYNLYAYYENSDNTGPFADLFYNRVDKNFSASTLFNGRVGEANDYDEINASGGYQWRFDRRFFSNISVNGGYYSSKILSTNFKMQDRLTVNLFTKITGYLNFSTYIEYNKPEDHDNEGNIITRKNFLQEYYLQYIFGNNSLYGGYFFGTYFGSNISNPYLGFNLNLFNKLSINTSLNYISLFDSDRTIINARMDYKIMKKLFIRAFYQKDTYSKASLLNAMLQYEFFAGSNIYLVLNLDGNNLQFTRRYFKFGYDFNL